MSTTYRVGGNQFQKSLEAFAEKAEQYADAIVHRVVIDLAASVMYDSPYGQPEFWKRPAPADYQPGHFRANWQYTTGAPADGIIPLFDPAGKHTLRFIMADVKPKGAASQVHYLVNNVPHGPPLEFDGHSWQAPQPGGVVKKNVLRFDAIVKNAVAQVVQ